MMKKLIVIGAILALAASANAQQSTGVTLNVEKPATKVQITKASAKAESQAPLYCPPLIRLFYGINDFASYKSVPAIEVYPAGEELYWENLNWMAQEISWSYAEASTWTTTTSTEDDLEVTYPLASLENGSQAPNGMWTNGTIVPAPVLTDDGETYSSSEYMQIGGAAALAESHAALANGEVVNYGLLPFCPQKDGLMVYAPDNAPIFGYSPDTQAWLTNYTFLGEPEENEWVYCDAIFNTVIATEQPLTVNGATFYGRGKLNDDAVLTFLIYPVTEDGEFIYTPIAEVNCAVADMIVTPDGEMNIYQVPFTLPQPLTMKASKSPYYLVGITGFYEAAEWFAPYQSQKPNEFELALAYYRCTTCFNGVVDDWFMWHVANFEDENGEMYSTFAINLDASYEAPEIVAGIDDIINDNAEDGEAYDLMGRKLAPNYRGIAIKNGKVVYIND